MLTLRRKYCNIALTPNYTTISARLPYQVKKFVVYKNKKCSPPTAGMNTPCGLTVPYLKLSDLKPNTIHSLRQSFAKKKVDGSDPNRYKRWKTFKFSAP